MIRDKGYREDDVGGWNNRNGSQCFLFGRSKGAGEYCTSSPIFPPAEELFDM